jgi:hypothetical protein
VDNAETQFSKVTDAKTEQAANSNIAPDTMGIIATCGVGVCDLGFVV